MKAESAKRSGTGIEPPAVLVDVVRALVDKDGETAVGKRLGISRASVARLRGGLPVRVGTIAQAQQALRHAS